MRLLLFLAATTAFAQKPEYKIYRATGPITIDAQLDEPSWQDAPPMSDFIFNWFTAGEKEATRAKLLWDDQYLYVSWLSSDKHISAYMTERHGAVSRDDCVEIFIRPNPKSLNYYTFEINAIGAMLNRARTDWWKGPPTWDPEGVEYRATYHGQPKKDESPDDQSWIVEMKVPLRNFEKDAVHTPPQDGDEWRMNLMRTGGKTNAQQSTWSPIAPEKKSFHTPENFGTVRFVNQPPPRRRVSAAEFEAGRALYNTHCTMCHGLNGQAGDRAPALAAQRRYRRNSEQDLFDAIKNGIRGTMMPASAMPESEATKVVAYLRALRATAADAPVDGDLASGESIFHGKGGCAKCHMLNGRGGILGPDLSNIAMERKTEELRDALTKAKPLPPRGYAPATIALKAGGSVRGVIKNEDNFSIQLLGAGEKLHLLDRSEIRQIVYEPQSLMPADYGKRLNAKEFQDLMAFLCVQAKHEARVRRRR